MGRKSRRSIYDPSIMDRVDDGLMKVDSSHSVSKELMDPLAMVDIDTEMSYNDHAPYHDDENHTGMDPDDVIVDPKLHPLQRRSTNRCRRWFLLGLMVGGVIAIVVTVSVIVVRNKNGHQDSKSPLDSNGLLKHPPSNLVEACASNVTDDIVECQELCQMAECCQYPSNFDLSCLKRNEQTCLEYRKACHALYYDDDNLNEIVTVPPAPANLSDICDMNQLTTPEGLQQCAAYCVPNHCCYEIGVASCQDQDACAGYSSCMHLSVSETVSGDIQTEVNLACQKESLQSKKGLFTCRNKCKLGECCFTTQGCPLNGDGFCQQYQACGVLYDGSLPPLSTTDDYQGIKTPDDDFLDDAFDPLANNGTQIPNDDFAIPDNPVLKPMPNYITNVCNATVWTANPGAKTVCAALCDEANCCNYAEGLPLSCLRGNHLQCLEYHRHCVILENQQTTTVDVGPAPTDLNDLCNADSLSTNAGRAQCLSMCQQGSCCFDLNVAQCGSDVDCPSYAPCLNLKASETVDPNIEDTVQESCTEERVKTVQGRAVCTAVCQQHTCCLDGTCYQNQPKICEQFAGCALLYDAGFAGNESHANVTGQPTISLPPVELAQTCNESNMGNPDLKRECESVCKAAECCNFPENSVNSCLKGNYDICFEFHKECSILYVGVEQADPNTFVIPEPTVDLADLCSSASLASRYGRVNCRQSCSEGECCWSRNLEPGESCRDFQQCIAYEPCMNLAASSYQDGSIVQEVEDFCTLESVQTPKGYELCGSVCQQHQCCWILDTDDSSCFDRGACDQYQGCKSLWQAPP